MSVVNHLSTRAYPGSPQADKHFVGFAYDPICPVMILELSDEQAAALERELRRIIDDDRYPLSPRIQMLREIRKHDPTRTEARAVTPLKYCEPPCFIRGPRG
jgi:hypothetical protein